MHFACACSIFGAVMMESREMQIEQETGLIRSFQCEADYIARLIVTTDLPWVDIAIKAEKFRQKAQRLFPRKTDLYELVYTSRFRRLWGQWRRPEPSEGLA